MSVSVQERLKRLVEYDETKIIAADGKDFTIYNKNLKFGEILGRIYHYLLGHFEIDHVAKKINEFVTSDDFKKYLINTAKKNGNEFIYDQLSKLEEKLRGNQHFITKNEIRTLQSLFVEAVKKSPESSEENPKVYVVNYNSLSDVKKNQHNSYAFIHGQLVRLKATRVKNDFVKGLLNNALDEKKHNVRISIEQRLEYMLDKAKPIFKKSFGHKYDIDKLFDEIKVGNKLLPNELKQDLKNLSFETLANEFKEETKKSKDDKEAKLHQPVIKAFPGIEALRAAQKSS